MRLSLLSSLLYASLGSATITWSLQRVSNPSTDESDAYTLITSAMDLAVARYNSLASSASKTITVQYNTGVTTADGSFTGTIRFGSNRSYMNERTALHEISHTLGIGQTTAFTDRCAANDWPTATPLLQTWDGSDAVINCGGGHIWPYGLNYDTEWSETNADRHCQLINAMLVDGLAG